jgi:hypothetical protein
VSPTLVQRQAALAAGALLATLGVLVLGHREDAVVAPPVAPRITWESAVVGVLPAAAYANKTSCGAQLDSGTIGVAHPLLPCGVDLVLGSSKGEVRTEVVARVQVAQSREFDLTKALADRLGVEDGERIRWRFAG